MLNIFVTFSATTSKPQTIQVNRQQVYPLSVYLFMSGKRPVWFQNNLDKVHREIATHRLNS